MSSVTPTGDDFGTVSDVNNTVRAYWRFTVALGEPAVKR
jgi:hypothetical protein